MNYSGTNLLGHDIVRDEDFANIIDILTTF